MPNDINPNTMSREELQRRTIAKKIVTAIIEDLNDRNGLEISSLDRDAQQEVRGAFFDIVLKELP